MVRGVFEKSGHGFFAFQRFHESFHRLAVQRFRGVLSDDLIGVGGEHHQEFGAIRRREVSRAGAHGEFALAGALIVLNFMTNFTLNFVLNFVLSVRAGLFHR